MNPMLQSKLESIPDLSREQAEKLAQLVGLSPYLSKSDKDLFNVAIDERLKVLSRAINILCEEADIKYEELD